MRTYPITVQFKNITPIGDVAADKLVVSDISLELSKYVAIHPSSFALLSFIKCPGFRFEPSQGIFDDINDLQKTIGISGPIKRTLNDNLSIRKLSLVNKNGDPIIVPVLTLKNLNIPMNDSINLFVKGKICEYKIGKQPLDSEIKVGDLSQETVDIKELIGTPISPGYGYAKAYIWLPWEKGVGLQIKKVRIEKNDVNKEIKKFDKALKLAEQHYVEVKTKLREAGYSSIDNVVDMHIGTCSDVEFINEIKSVIKGQGYNKIINGKSVLVESGNCWNVEYAVSEIINEKVKFFIGAKDPEFQKFSKDYEDIGHTILDNLLAINGHATKNKNMDINKMTDDVIIVAEKIMITDLVTLLGAQARVRGFVVDDTGAAGHADFIARIMEKPCVGGLENASKLIQEDDMVYVNGITGKVLLNHEEASPKVMDFMASYKDYTFYKDKIEKAEKVANMEDTGALYFKTVDGITFKVKANIAIPEEIPKAYSYGFSGVSLYRTEFGMLNYLQNGNIPTRDQLADSYINIAKQMHIKDKFGYPISERPIPINFRLFDYGGDKLSGEFDVPLGMNPFLGIRGVRLYQYDKKWEQIAFDQMQAILMASHYNPDVSAMVPMITTYNEFIWCREKVFDEAREKLSKEKIPFFDKFKFGTMIETPSSVFIAPDLARSADFFSFGANDYVQYFMAADRGDKNVSYLSDPFHPGVIRSLELAKQAADFEGKSMSSCGNISSDPLFLMILFATGITEVGVMPADIPKVKYMLEVLSQQDCKSIVSEYMANYNTIDGRTSREKLKNVIKQYIKAGNDRPLTILERIETIEKMSAINKSSGSEK